MTRRRGRALLVAGFAAVLGSLAACPTRSYELTQTGTIRDSLGITIVESTTPAWRPNEEWRIAEVPNISIGTMDGPLHDQLTDVRGVVQLSDGRIVVANAGTMEIRCYSSGGKFLWTSGRRGQGPGDYWMLTSLSRYRGDSLLVHDFGLRRYSVIDASGRFARSLRLQLPDDSTTAGSLQHVGALEDGTIAVSSSPPRRGQAPPTMTRRSIKLLTFSANGEPTRLLGAFPGDEYYEGAGFAIHRLPFARSTRFAVGARAIFVATDDTYEIRELRRDGRPAVISRREVAQRGITNEDVASTRKYLQAHRRAERMKLFRGMPDTVYSRLAADEEFMFAELPFPPTYPAYGRIIVDQQEFLWVEAFSPRPDADTSGTMWSVFHPDGRWLGDVRLPPRLTLYTSTIDHVLGVQTDDMGVEYVRAFPIIGRRVSMQ